MTPNNHLNSTICIWADPLKKQKVISDYFDCEQHGNEPPSTSQSHEHTEDKAETIENLNTEPDCKAADPQTSTEFQKSSNNELGDILNGSVPLFSLSEMEKILM